MGKYKFRISKFIGIYQIRNNINNKRYIGQTVNIYNRWDSHIQSLINNKHMNGQLQKDFNEYGLLAFEFSILELIGNDDKEQLNLLEQKYLDTLDFSFDYNSKNVIPRKTKKYICKEEVIIPSSKIRKGIINTRKFVEIFGTDKNKEYYKRQRGISTSVRDGLLKKAQRYCNITYLGNGKYEITKVFTKPKPKTRKSDKRNS